MIEISDRIQLLTQGGGPCLLAQWMYAMPMADMQPDYLKVLLVVECACGCRSCVA